MLLKNDVLCGGLGRSDMNLLFGCGLAASSEFAMPGIDRGVAEVLCCVGPPLAAGFLLGTEEVGGIEFIVDDSALFPGKGNSSAGGIGRIFVQPSSTVDVPGMMVSTLPTLVRRLSSKSCHSILADKARGSWRMSSRRVR